MATRQLRAPSVLRLLLLILLVGVAGAAAVMSGGLRSLAQSEEAQIEALFGTPPLDSIPPDTSVVLNRISYDPGEVLDLDYPGPIMLFVESGELAIPDTAAGQPIVLLYSGPDTSPPPIRADNGEQVLLPGYAALVESGQLGTTRNPSAEPTVALAVFLIPERTAEMEMTVEEATAAP